MSAVSPSRRSYYLSMAKYFALRSDYYLETSWPEAASQAAEHSGKYLGLAYVAAGL